MEVKNLANQRRLRYGARAILLTTSVILASLLLYGVIEKKHLRWDTTANREFTLSEQTLKVLNDLSPEVKIRAFFRNGSDPDEIFIRRKVNDVLKEYAARSSKIDYQLIDPDREVAAVTQYHVTMAGTVVFQSGKNRKEVYQSQLFDYSRMSEATLPEFAGEGLFTNALLKVTRAKSPVVCFLEGHGERGLADTEATGFSSAHDFLAKNNYEVRHFSFVTEKKIPPCDLLMVAGPHQKITELEDRTIQHWVSKGHPLLLLGEAMEEAPLPATLAALQLKWDDDLVLDPKRHFLLGPHYPAPILSDHEITKGLKEMNPIFSLARSLTVLKEAQVTPLLTTTDEAWGETNLQEGSEPKLEGNDLKGPLLLGVGIETEKPLAVVVGDTDFASNGLIQSPGNLDLFLNMVGWLVGEKDQVVIRPKRPEFRTLSLTGGYAKLIAYFTQLGYPLLVLGMGGTYWLRRRSR